MRILLTGASGLIGSALRRALLADGHELICVARQPNPGVLEARCRWLAADFAQVPPAGWWLPHLAGVDAVINAVGILREQRGQTFQALHTQTPAELFRACEQAGVGTVIQISALGADESAASGYHRSKRDADDVLRGLPLRGAVLQPSLVFSPQGPSTALFMTLAAAPVLAMPLRGRMQVQPLHLDDVVAAVKGVLQAPPAPVATVALAGPAPMALRDYLASLRHQLGFRLAQWMLPLPVRLFTGMARLAAKLPGSFLDAETASMLLRGNTAPAEGAARLIGHAPRPAAHFIPPAEAPALRREAVLGLWLPVLRAALAAMWIWTGVVSFGLYPVQDSLALLARAGLHGAMAFIALYGAAVLDIALGLLTIMAPVGWRGAVWASQLALIAGYTVLISLFLAEQWLHPYGPISKNLPIMAAIALLWSLEPAGKGRG